MHSRVLLAEYGNAGDGAPVQDADTSLIRRSSSRFTRHRFWLVFAFTLPRDVSTAPAHRARSVQILKRNRHAAIRR